MLYLTNLTCTESVFK